jgi:SAM-dependent methyltransferase
MGTLTPAAASDPRDALACPRCRFRLSSEEGIWRALPRERLEYFERFIHEYESVRAFEGRGSADSNFYLQLPFGDSTGRNTWQWNVRARSYHCLVHEVLVGRSNVAQRILDLGAGNGWLSHRLALLGHQPVAVDLLTNSRDGLGAASHYLSDLPGLFPRFQAEMDHLPFEDDQFDCAVFNASFHYSEDYIVTLGEALRCVRSGGLIVILDSPWYSEALHGRQMVLERRRAFQKHLGFPSDALVSRDFLTDDDLRALKKTYSIQWRIRHPWYGLRMAARPWLAALKSKREPATFRIYTAETPI